MKQFHDGRRRALRGMLGAGGLALFGRRVFAQGAGGASGRGAAELLRVPKHALVIGNSSYKNSPLRNPVNDARGMTEALKGAGFAVTTLTEASRAAMQDAIQAHAEGLAKSRAVGLFYFAGHGAQLAWRNYLIPLDAEIGDAQELRERGVDVNGLIEGIRKAGNLMNLIILDACRDNPFGSARRLDQKGLSQLDAPSGTLLAYATAPGNTAIDGEGEHGLYTGHLLQEMKVPETKVEDVFKRVRLAVRRRSNGLQIPWESTSLEDDFWFVPPRELKKLAEEEIEREFRQELAVWERTRGAAAPEPFEDYLRRYPSGRFTELAQLHLDRVLMKLGERKVEVLPAPENPYTKGTVTANTAYRIGDLYIYRQLDLLTKLELKRLKRVVTGIAETEVHFNEGRYVTDLLGNSLKFPNGAVWSPNQTAPTEFAVGRRWRTRFRIVPSEGGDTVIDLDMRIADRERITVPAGTFNAFRVEAGGYQTGQRTGDLFVSNRWDWKTWYAPGEVRLPVAAEVLVRNAKGTLIRSERNELLKFHQS
ncbi:MAG: caspase family protein [Burkholderiales bacterium]|nr:caspase family protein [Burkholderiales bacterium]